MKRVSLRYDRFNGYDRVSIDYNEMMSDIGFKEYLISNFGEPSLVDKIMCDGLPISKMKILKESKISALINRYIEYVDYVKRYNRNCQLNKILE